MNLLAFDSIAEYKEVLNDKTFVRIKTKKWPTVGNESMKKYAYTKWQPDKKYVILLNQYQTVTRDLPFNGERLVVIDGGDKPKVHHPWWAKADIWLKENSVDKVTYDVRRNPKFRIGCYCPSVKTPFCILKHDVKPYWMSESFSKLDMFFAGDYHMGRRKKLGRWKKWCKESNLSYKFCTDDTYRRGKYLEMMAKSAICLSFTGHGSRSRREWEALLCGSFLFQDDSLRVYPLVLMKQDVHFVFFPTLINMGKIRETGYKLANKCFMQSPSIDIRMAALYLFFNVSQLYTYEEVEKAEKHYGLRS